MSLKNRREFLFLYSVKDANPNGDPLNENHPRFDEDTLQAMASDVRVKRTIRDQLMREGKNVFIDAEAKSLKQRVDELKAGLGTTSSKEVIKQCIDTRLFGVTFALGRGKDEEAFSWTGPVQFKWARSLNACTFTFIQGTSAFAREDKDSQVKQQRSFRNEYKVPFALMSCYGIANQFPSEETGASDKDVDDMLSALWAGTDNLITRSKTEHKSRFLLDIVYKEGFAGKIAGLDEKLSIEALDGHRFSKDEEKSLRSLSEFLVNVSALAEAILNHKDEIEKVQIICDPELKLTGDDDLRKFSRLSLETR